MTETKLVAPAVERPTLLDLTDEQREVLALMEEYPDDPALADRLAASVLAIPVKVDGYVAVHDEFEARAEALRAVAKRMTEQARVYENGIERLKFCARVAAGKLGTDRLSGHGREIRIVRSKADAIDIKDEAGLPERFKTQIVVTKVDKAKIAGMIAVTAEGSVIDPTTGEDLSTFIGVRPVIVVRFR